MVNAGILMHDDDGVDLRDYRRAPLPGEYDIDSEDEHEINSEDDDEIDSEDEYEIDCQDLYEIDSRYLYEIDSRDLYEIDSENEYYEEDEVETRSHIESQPEVSSENEADGDLTNDGDKQELPLRDSSTDNSANAKPAKPLGLMDLATELRLMIVKYALTDKKDLKWKWTRHSYRTDAGTFKGTTTLANLTAISRVSRQLYNETKGLVWKLNTFCFVESASDDYYRDSDTFEDELERTEDAYDLPNVTSAVQLLGRTKHPWPTRHIQHVKIIRRSVTGRNTRSYPGLETYRFLREIRSLAAMIPGVRVTLYDYNWYFYEPAPNYCQRYPALYGSEQLAHFFYKGCDILACKDNWFLIDGHVANWKIFPAIDSWALEWLYSVKAEDEHVDQGMVELAKKWIHHGLGSIPLHRDISIFDPEFVEGRRRFWRAWRTRFDRDWELWKKINPGLIREGREMAQQH